VGVGDYAEDYGSSSHHKTRSDGRPRPSPSQGIL
jgi:hypothetical protein